MDHANPNQGFWYQVTQSGWFVALAAATWGIILRALIGKYSELQKEAKEERALVIRSLEENRIAIAALANRIALLEDHDDLRRSKR